ncbi:NAD-binding protein [Halorubrum sp. FL23]|uniref:NAD-binding protein n=1 Tax=Halorubrum sp. FL23 TaxID=3458704 RepID=UPI0040336E87
MNTETLFGSIADDSSTKDSMRITVIGAGEVGRAIAATLSDLHKVIIIERDQRIGSWIAACCQTDFVAVS